MYRKIIRPLLFAFPPEGVHQRTLWLIGIAGKIPTTRILLNAVYQPKAATNKDLLGLNFPNRVGLAAGFDKDAEAVLGLASLGFGHIEVGTVTPLPQSGNSKPRIFRLPEDCAVINRMGFPGKGARYVANQLRRQEKPENLILGVNIGKNKDTPLAEADRDYVFLVDTFAALADYLTINISSPNTVGLRLLQHSEYLDGLLESICEQRDRQENKLGKAVPLLVKLSPDLDEEELKATVQTILKRKINGIIATNTTTRRDNLASAKAKETGGLSGKPLTQVSTGMIKKIRQITGNDFPLIGVGGIASPSDASDKINAGADLVQIYTGLIYQGPMLVKRIVETIDTPHLGG